MALFSLGKLNKYFRNRILFNIVVKTVAGVMKALRPAVLAAELKAIVHPFAGQSEMLAEKRRFIQWSRPAKFMLRKICPRDDSFQDRILGIADIGMKRIGKAGKAAPVFLTIFSISHRQHRLQQLLILGCKQIILIADCCIREQTWRINAGVYHVIERIHRLGELPVFADKEEYLVQAHLIIPNLLPGFSQEGKCL